MLTHPATEELGVPQTVLDLALDPAARWPSRPEWARMLDDQLRQLIQGEPMLTLRLGRVLDEMTRKYGRLGYVRLSDYGLEELGIGERTIRNYARMKELLGRPVLLAAFLSGRLSRSHVLLLLNLPTEEDAEWVARVSDDMSVTRLRALLKERLPAEESAEEGAMGVLEFELEPEVYVDWLFAKELACRRSGSDLPGYAVKEHVLAEYVAAAPLPDQEAAPFFVPPIPLPSPAAPVRKEHAPDCACCHVKAARLPAELTVLLPHDPRKLAVMARGLMQAREASELLQHLILRRLQDHRLHRELGFRRFRDYLQARGLAASTVYGHTARNRLVEAHPLLQRALIEGRLTRSKVDALLPLAGSCDLNAWIEYGEQRTWRRFRMAVETALAMKAKAPAAWARRRKRPPQEGETLEDLRQQAGLPTLEAAMDELQRRVEAYEAGGVQTFSSTTRADIPGSGPVPATTAPGAPPVPATVPAADGLTTPVTTPVQTSSSTAPADRGLTTPVTAPVQTSSSTAIPAETADGAPSPTIRLRIPYPRSLDPLLKAAHEAACRVAGRELTREEALHRHLLFFLLTQEEPDSAARGDRLKALQRAGWQCEVPGCRSRCNLHVHHLEYRSRGGKDRLPNYVVLCAAHHLHHVHQGRITVEGEEPVNRLWDVGIVNGVPYRTYVDDRLVDAWEWGLEEEEQPDRVAEAVTPYLAQELPRAA